MTNATETKMTKGTRFFTKYDKNVWVASGETATFHGNLHFLAVDDKGSAVYIPEVNIANTIPGDDAYLNHNFNDHCSIGTAADLMATFHG